jgi:hypothetical protein
MYCIQICVSVVFSVLWAFLCICILYYLLKCTIKWGFSPIIPPKVPSKESRVPTLRQAGELAIKTTPHPKCVNSIYLLSLFAPVHKKKNISIQGSYLVILSFDTSFKFLSLYLSYLVWFFRSVSVSISQIFCSFSLILTAFNGAIIGSRSVQRYYDVKINQENSCLYT